MEIVLIKAFTFILIIVLGYVLKHLGFFKPNDFRLISKIVMNITLPCAVISNFSKLSLEASLLILVVLGLGCNLIMIGIGYFISWRKSSQEKAFNMINLSGYNIGCFTMPYVQSFLGPVGVVATCLFDAGNAFLCTGATYSIASSVVDNGEKTNIKSFLKKTFSSIPMDTYLIMLVFSMLHIKLPEMVLTFTDTVGAANGFLAMLMIGIGFELNLKRSQLAQIARSLVIRYGIAVMFALLFYFLLPLPLEVRQVLVLVVFSPISSVCIVFTGRCGGNVALSSTMNSISIVISIIIMTGILLGMNIS